MNKSVFQMVADVLTSDVGILCAVKAWLWTLIIVLVLCLPIVIKESVRAALDIYMSIEIEKRLKKEKREKIEEYRGDDNRSI